MKTFKVHTDTLGRLTACIQKAMYGITRTAFRDLPADLLGITKGDIVFISEREISNNALFGPFYITDSHNGLVARSEKNSWVQIDLRKSNPNALAYWVAIEKRYFCLLFDETLNDRISIVWPNDWQSLNLTLPSWGLVEDQEAKKLLEFSIKNQEEAKKFFRRHNIR